MPDDVKISEMSEAASLDNSAQFPYVQSMNGNLTTLKAPLTQIGTKINESMTFSNLQTTSKTIVGAINEAAQGGGVEYATELPISSTDPTDTKSYIDNKTTLVKSASGSLIHITDGGDNIPLKSCEVTINPDLSGKAECNLVVCGKNLVVASDLRATATHDSVTFTKYDGGRFTVTGTNSSATYGGYLSNNASILLKAGHTYRISGNWSGLTPSSSTVRVDLRYGSTIYLHENTDSFTPTEDIICYLGYRINANYTVPNGTVCSPCVTVDNSDTTYTPYNGTTYNIPFGQTVYGGEGNALTGEFVSEWGKYTITNDTILTNYNTSVEYGSWAMVSQIGVQKIDNTNIMAFCDVATGVSFNQRIETANQRRVYTDQTGQIVIRAAATDNITSLEDLKNLFMGANICYVLATPTSLTPTPVNPKTISGINNIYNDCGDTAIEYFTSSADGLAALIEVLSNS